jgi:hypothetical protein
MRVHFLNQYTGWIVGGELQSGITMLQVVSKPHLTPDDGVGRLRGIPRLILGRKGSHTLFKMLTYH